MAAIMDFRFPSSRKKIVVPFIQWKVQNTMAEIDIIQNGEGKCYTKDFHSCGASVIFFFIINFTLKTCMYFAGGDATLFPVPVTWETNERWKRCCECMGGDANIGKNVSAFRWMSKLWGLRENSLKFYCGSLLLTCLYVTAKCKCKRQHVRSIFNGLDSVGARVYFHFCQHFDALAHDLQKKNQHTEAGC